jgi:cation diffusion facilitator CzcD-associated flavoprotein CzcO
VERGGTGETFTEDADIVISARGNLNDMAWPNIPGLDAFKGEKMHSASWNQEYAPSEPLLVTINTSVANIESYDFRGKRIGLIGGGSSAIQIVPELQKVEGTKLTAIVRSKVWISNRFGDYVMQDLGWDPKELICKAVSSVR